MRILVVEDDRKVAGFMQSGLQQEGHAVDVLNDGTVAGDRACAAGRAHECTLRVADLEMDTMRRTVRRGGRAIDLKPKEYALLEFLMQHSEGGRLPAGLRPVMRLSFQRD